ncbi:MAG: hypothetical protein ACM3S1_02190 [Hyphomicrobiales bacterium]
MRPDVTKVLQGIAGTLAMQVLPEVRTPYGQQTVGLASQLCFMISQEFDRAAARLVEENAAILGIFERALSLLDEGPLAAKLRAATQTVPGADLRISALQAENDNLRALLIELHAAVEAYDGEEMAGLNRIIWDELRESTRRRHVASGLA